MEAIENAYALLKQWKEDHYVFGTGVTDKIGELTSRFGKKVLLISSKTYTKQIERAIRSMKSAGCTVVNDTFVPGAKPNAPREDVYRIETYILQHRPDVVVAIGAGSTIDACKAAIVLSALGKDVTPEIDHYFGANVVTEDLKRTGNELIPYIAVQTSASSGAHLTKYSNITDPVAGQKLLIIDNAIVPSASMFDYESTLSMPASLSIDGALDGLSHTFEVFCGAKPSYYDLAKQLAETAFDLILSNTKKVIENPFNMNAREALGLATDLGGYAIMVGGTSGAHLTSFSLVDLVAHGSACGIMNPYFTVFYAPAIQDQLLVIGNVLKKHGFLKEDLESLHGRQRAVAVSTGMIAFEESISAPTKLSDLQSFGESHISRILTAAKQPSLATKLQNMPIPMTASDVDDYLEPVIRAAAAGSLELVINKP